MLHLKLENRPPIALSKEFFTVGFGSGYDLGISGESRGMLFSVRSIEGGTTLFPGDSAIRINGARIRKPVSLNPCDRIEWDKGVALVLDEALTPGKSGTEFSHHNPMPILKLLSQSLENGDSLSDALALSLEAIVQEANAECGAIVCESANNDAWNLVAATRGTAEERKDWISHTLLTEAIRTRKPVYVQSIIGHPWQHEASILEAQVYSIACVPLLSGTRVSGALYLYTRTPGRSVLKAALDDLQVVTSQVALLISRERAVRTLVRDTGAGPKGLVYDCTRKSSAMKALLERIEKLSPHDLSLLICGETGTGKELAAREVHRLSTRANGPFITVNCAAIPPTLMESVLFGACKGAYTGAVKDTPGKFRLADKGTLFLDEIGDLPLDLQSKLLRVLQEKEVEAVGAPGPTPVDVRIVAATHQDIPALVQSGKFRQDLYYRLNGATLVLPPLRQRGSDEIVVLARHFLSQLGDFELSEEATARLKEHPWPGNVRELEQVIRRAVALSSGATIERDAIEIDRSPMGSSATLFEGTLKEMQARFTSDFITQVLAQCHGNRAEASQRLGISERTLYRLLAADNPDRA